MKIKRVVAADIRQAISRVREELGPDAVILSNRSVDNGVELVAAIDYDDSVLHAAEPSSGDIQAASRQTPVHQPSPGNVVRDRQSDMTMGADPAMVDLRQEMHSLRTLVESQFAEWTWHQMQRRQPARAELLQRLMTAGFDRDLSNYFLDQMPDDQGMDAAWSQLQQNLAASITVTNTDVLDKGGVVALLGATGVGKTTSIAKLAARFCLSHGARHLALITTDSYRIGAQEQLFNYGRILDVPVRAATSQEELASAINAFADKRLVLIDTAGVSQRDIRINEQLQILNGGNTPVHAYIVLSAATQAGALEEAINAFQRQGLQGCILTKLDECQTLGGALGAVIRHQLPVAFVSDGQRVPEDIHAARPLRLVQQCVEQLEKIHAEKDESMNNSFEGVPVHAYV